jgi:hypothetical protein
MSEPIRIVLDTNQFYNDWLLEVSPFVAIERACRLNIARLVVPKIVFLEVLNLYRRRLREFNYEVEKLRRSAPGRLELPIQALDIDKLGQEYDRLLELRLKDLDTEIPDHAGIPHAAIVQRALDIRRPFRESDKGYRDTLLWEVILESVVSTDAKTILVSDNWRDFSAGEHSAMLHSDLLDDLTRKGFSAKAVEFTRDLSNIVKERIFPLLTLAHNLAIDELKTGRLREFSVEDWFRRSRETIIAGIDSWVGSFLSEDYYFDSPSISYVEDPRQITIVDVKPLDGDTTYIEALAETDVIVDVFAEKWETEYLEEQFPFDVQEWDWNDQMSWGQLTLDLPIAFSIVLDTAHLEVTACEIFSISRKVGWCAHCGQPILSDSTDTCRVCGRTVTRGR